MNEFHAKSTFVNQSCSQVQQSEPGRPADKTGAQCADLRDWACKRTFTPAKVRSRGFVCRRSTVQMAFFTEEEEIITKFARNTKDENSQNNDEREQIKLEATCFLSSQITETFRSTSASWKAR